MIQPPLQYQRYGCYTYACLIFTTFGFSCAVGGVGDDGFLNNVNIPNVAHNDMDLNVTIAIVNGTLPGDPERSISLHSPEQVWTICERVASWASMVVVPVGMLPLCDNTGQSSASRATRTPILVACGNPTSLQLSDSVGLITVFSSNGNTWNATSVVELREAVNTTIGVTVDNGLWDPLQPRELMLHGAELIINFVAPHVTHTVEPHHTSVTPHPPSSDADEAMLLTRGFENVAAVLQVEVTGVGTALANWCNDMLSTGCLNGSRMLPVTLQDHVARVSFSLQQLRAQRSSTIWGDAFRRPFAYQPLCGLSPLPLRQPPTTPTTPSPPPPPTTTSASSSSESISTLSRTSGDFEVKVALLQLVACETVTECRDQLGAAIQKAAADGADVALTPEMWSMGYAAQWTSADVPLNSPTNLRSAFDWTKLAEPVGDDDGGYIAHVKSLAMKHNVAIAAGMMRREAGPLSTATLWPPKNSVVLVDSQGEVLYVYDKVHTCDWSPEEALTTPGRNWATAILQTRGGNLTVGSMICADREFPESARTLAMHGAELILTPNACGLVDAQLRQFSTRAVENVLGVAMTNYAHSKSCCNGRSVAYGHDGVSLAGPAGSDEEILIATFNIRLIREARASAWGKQQLDLLTNNNTMDRVKLCDLHRQSAFSRPNVYGRVAGSVV